MEIDAHPPAPPAPTAERLREALERISAATPGNTNSRTPDQMRTWCKAVADSALADTPELPHDHQSPPATLEKPAWLRDEVNPDPSPRFRFWNRRKFEWTGTDWIMHLGELPHVHHHPDNVPSRHLDAIVDAALTHIANEKAPSAAACDHVWRGSDASTFDSVCTKCGITDTQKERRRQAPPAAPVGGVTHEMVQAAIAKWCELGGFTERVVPALVVPFQQTLEAALAARSTPDDGCPKGDPECLGGNTDCHDACSTFAERGAVEAAVAAERAADLGVVAAMGWGLDRPDEGEPERFAALVRFPNGPPNNLTLSTVWDRKPVRIIEAIRPRASTPAAIDGLAPGGRDGTEG